MWGFAIVFRWLVTKYSGNCGDFSETCKEKNLLILRRSANRSLWYRCWGGSSNCRN